MSTNDTVVAPRLGCVRRGRRPGELTAALTAVCADLARQLIADAEGAAPRHRHRGAPAPRASTTRSRSARAVARNNLFKCAVFGNDPNWGRVLAAVGTTRAAFEPDEPSTCR